MANCTPATFSGLGECKAFLEKTNGASLQRKGTIWDGDDPLNLQHWHKNLASTTGINAIMLPVSSFVKTTDELEVITTPLGKKIAGSEPIPSGILYLDASLCDYQTLYEMSGIPFEYVPFSQGNTFAMTRTADGKHKGARCTIATIADFAPDDKTQSYPVYLFFEDASEFKNMDIFSGYYFTPKTLEDLVPSGLTARVITPYASGGEFTVKVTGRCSTETIASLTDPTYWKVIETNAPAIVAVTAINTAGADQGIYTLTVKADSLGTPEDLKLGEYAKLQAVLDDGTYISHMSQVFQINGV